MCLVTLYHRSGPLLPVVDGQPKYAQLYFYDSQATLEHCCQLNESLNPDILRSLEEMLVNHHQYVPIYHHALEVLQNYDPNNDVSIRLRVAPGYHRHRGQYNLPTADKVAVILPGVEGDDTQYSQRDIILQRHVGDLQIISDLHPAYVPLYYVLLFLYGENGWHPALKLLTSDEQRGAKCLTLTRYVAYQLQSHPSEYLTLLRGGRLLQCYMVDMYTSIDQDQLYWLRTNQPTIRACLYSGLEDATEDRDGVIDLQLTRSKIHTTIILRRRTTSYAAVFSRFHGNCMFLWTSRHLHDRHYESTMARNHTRTPSTSNSLR